MIPTIVKNIMLEETVELVKNEISKCYDKNKSVMYRNGLDDAIKCAEKVLKEMRCK